MKTMNDKPFPNESNGQDHGAGGRFQRGNKAACGHKKPHAAKVSQLRAALLEAVNPEDIRAVIDALVAEAKKGNVAAAREILDRAVGKPIEADLLERLEELESDLGLTAAP